MYDYYSADDITRAKDRTGVDDVIATNDSAFTKVVSRGSLKRRKQNSRYDESYSHIYNDTEPAHNSKFRQLRSSSSEKPTKKNGTRSTSKTLMVVKQAGEQFYFNQPMAAKKWSNYISKAVYCIDNIDFSTKIDELKDFITNKLSVKVISLFEVKPRRSAWHNSNYHADHSTFRLCIPRDDNYTLLQLDVWPEDIMISTWFRA